MDLKFSSSFINFLMSESEDILSQPSDSNQSIRQKNHKEVKISHQRRIVYLSLHG